jgi:HEAT repeat protein
MASLTSFAAEFRWSIGTSIPQIADLLKDSERFVRSAGAEALSKLSEKGPYYIWSGIASLTSIAAEFRGSIGTSIPQIVDLLKDSDGFVRGAGAKALSQLSKQGP